MRYFVISQEQLDNLYDCANRVEFNLIQTSLLEISDPEYGPPLEGIIQDANAAVAKINELTLELAQANYTHNLTLAQLDGMEDTQRRLSKCVVDTSFDNQDKVSAIIAANASQIAGVNTYLAGQAAEVMRLEAEVADLTAKLAQANELKISLQGRLLGNEPVGL